ncbi:hypothetical protein [Cutibacterium sp.]|uniref:hypothetical protein n=1 Tax=Cutibacterium sp. TaxID=1912221 RepID=UPI0026DBCFC1|nr:hypothetical protein [Cutibacterium sp.]MDO4412547.1 hypothetical protein [Cutibacterium sp.]
MRNNLSIWSSGIIVIEIAALIVMIVAWPNWQYGGSSLYSCVFGILLVIACILGLIAAVKGPGSVWSRWVHGIGCVVLIVGVASFIIFDEPTSINVFGFLAVIVGVIGMIVGTILIQATRTRSA